MGSPEQIRLQQLVRPLLLQLRALHQTAQRTGGRRPLLALNGPVGAGKSSLGRELEALAPAYGLRLVVASIDDLYCTWPERGRRLAGNPFGVSRVPPGSHDIPLLLRCLEHWRRHGELHLPRFDKTLAGGQGDRQGWRVQPCDAVLLEGWLMGCRPVDPDRLLSWRDGPPPANGPQHRQGCSGAGTAPDPLFNAICAPPLTSLERSWLPHWNRELAAYQALWEACDGLWVLRPMHWQLPRRWRLQAEARQRRAGGGWLPAADLEALVRASLCSLPPALYQDPLLQPTGRNRLVQTWPPEECARILASKPGPDSGPLEGATGAAAEPILREADAPNGWECDSKAHAATGAARKAAAPVADQGRIPLQGAAWLDGRRRIRRVLLSRPVEN